MNKSRERARRSPTSSRTSAGPGAQLGIADLDRPHRVLQRVDQRALGLVDGLDRALEEGP